MRMSTGMPESVASRPIETEPAGWVRLTAPGERRLPHNFNIDWDTAFFADVGGIARFLGVAKSMIPSRSEQIDDPISTADYLTACPRNPGADKFLGECDNRPRMTRIWGHADRR